jgi:2-dehydropantoate 2-reductase
MHEMVSIGRAEGVALADDEVERAMARVDAVSPTMTSSMHHDLERGNRLEAPWLCGAVVDIGARAAPSVRNAPIVRPPGAPCGSQRFSTSRTPRCR